MISVSANEHLSSQLCKTINIFEGIGGSGKTTVINLLLAVEKNLHYVHEDRDPPPSDLSPWQVDKYYLHRNIVRMNEEVKKVGSLQSIIFDRSYISSIAVAYGKAMKIGASIDIEGNLEYISSFSENEIDTLFVCLCEAKKAVARRTKRDFGVAHPIWSDVKLVDYVNQFYLNYGFRFARKVVYLNTGDDDFYSKIAEKVTNEKINFLAKELNGNN